MHLPAVREIEAARKAFRQSEPRDLFYRVATELIDLSIRKVTTLSVPEALSVLLQTWNKNFYRFHDAFSERHLMEIEDLVNSSWAQIAAFRERSIESLGTNDEPGILSLFTDFERALGAVGSAPRFFPLWDRAITKAYRIWLRPGPSNADLYLRFMGYAKQQCKALRKEGETSQDLLALRRNSTA